MKNLDDVRNELSAAGLADYFEALAPLAKNALRITPEAREDGEIPIGVSKFGGCPDLPEGVEWFRRNDTDAPLSFIGQINFAETAPYDLENKLPKTGMLYFFYDCCVDTMPWGFEPDDADGWRVHFYDGDPASLSRREAPEDLEQYENGMLFGAARLSYDTVLELPAAESDLLNGLHLPREDHDRYWDWTLGDEEAEDEIINKLLGHADPVQDGMELECEYVTHKISCGTPEGYAIAKERGLDKNASRWNLLMQVDSNDGDLGMMWGDMGRLYLWITDEDLAARNFEKAWLILQCG